MYDFFYKIFIVLVLKESAQKSMRLWMLYVFTKNKQRVKLQWLLYVGKNCLKDKTFESHHMQFGPQIIIFYLFCIFPSATAKKWCVIFWL